MKNPNPKPDSGDAPAPTRRLPSYLRRRLRPGGRLEEVEQLLRRRHLHTVCQSAHCPNRGECFSAGTATFMILGDTCTRHCRFCAVPSEPPPGPVDPTEPERIAAAAEELGLRYVVITSVTRDDLALGGAEAFAECIRALRARLPDSCVEVLTPDFQGDQRALERVLAERPDVYNHNVETVPNLYPAVRPEADYARSIDVIRRASAFRPRPVVKSGLMVGLGETREQVLGVFDDLAGAGCDLLTIGQYLAPGKDHHAVVEFVPPEQFDWYRKEALRRGFREVFAGPFVRSSYHAAEVYGMSGRQPGSGGR